MKRCKGHRILDGRFRRLRRRSSDTIIVQLTQMFFRSAITTSWGGSQTMSERQERKYRRFKLGYPVRVKLQTGGPIAEVESISKNISIGGLLLESTSMIPEHTPVTFLIRIEEERSGRPIYLAGEGKTVRVESIGKAFAIAVECKAVITQLEDYLPRK